MRLFDRSEPGAWVSGAAHAALLGAVIVGFAWEAFPEIQEGIAVEVISDSQFAEMTRGERQADTVQPDLKPRVDRVAETVEERDPGEALTPVPSAPTRPPEMQVAAREVAPPPPPPPMPPRREVAKVEPPPAPPRREVERKPEAKPEAKPETTREDVAKVAAREAEAKAKAETEARQRAEDALAKAEAKAVAEREKAEAKAEREKAAAEAKARAEAEARQRVEEQARERAEAEAKAVQQAKAIAEAKLVTEAKLKAEAKAKAEAEAKAKRLAEVAERFNPGDIRQLLASKEPAQATGSTGRELQRTAALGTATGNAQKLNPSQISALEGHLRDQIQNHYTQVPGSKNDAVTNPVMEIRLNPDGSLSAEPRLLKVGPKPIDRAVAEAALRAVRKAAPFRIPAQFAPYYNGWKVLNPEFTPE